MCVVTEVLFEFVGGPCLPAVTWGAVANDRYRQSIHSTHILLEHLRLASCCPATLMVVWHFLSIVFFPTYESYQIPCRRSVSVSLQCICCSVRVRSCGWLNVPNRSAPALLLRAWAALWKQKAPLIVRRCMLVCRACERALLTRRSVRPSLALSLAIFMCCAVCWGRVRSVLCAYSRACRGPKATLHNPQTHTILGAGSSAPQPAPAAFATLLALIRGCRLSPQPRELAGPAPRHHGPSAADTCSSYRTSCRCRGAPGR